MDLNFLRSKNRSDQPLGGRYQIVEQLGEGGFGQTFRAQDLHLPGHPLCVVKQLKPQVNDAQGLQVARRLFDTEAKVLYQLGSHPQIPKLLAHFEDNKEFYLAQELIDGHSLENEFANTPWDVPKVINFLGDVLETLTFVHEHRVIHRDLKPSNLIRRHSDRRIVVIDFGAVKQAGTQPATGHGISHTISIGTQGYMPSEQLAGQPQFSSDVYAVGMMGIQAVTGQEPKQLMPHAQTGEIDWHRYVPQIPLELRTLLDTMVRYDFRARYPSAQEALAALQALPSSLKQHVTRPPASASVTTKPPATEMTVAAMGRPPATSVARTPTPRRSREVSSTSSRPLPVTAILAGLGTLVVGLLIGRACSSAISEQTDPVVISDQSQEQTPEPSPEQPRDRATDQATAPLPDPAPIDETPIEQPGDSEPAESVPDLPVEQPPETVVEQPESLPEDEAVVTPADAQTVVTTFYNHISNQSWDQARNQTSGSLARAFQPSFFQGFQQVSVENLQITNQTSETIELVGQNTYVYGDGSFQTEERTFTVELVDGQPRIVDSGFVRVIKARSDG